MKQVFLAFLGAALLAWLYYFCASASPLDDAYIYFQYARSAAHGYFFIYQAGDAPSSGVSGLLYYLILSFFAKLGWEGPSVAWAIGSASLFSAFLAWLRLCGKAFPGLPKGLSFCLFLGTGPFIAAYFNGLETGLFFALFFWSLEALAGEEIPSYLWPLLAFLALSRPEGQLAALLFGAWALRRGSPRLPALATLLVVALPSLLLMAVTGSLIPDSVRPKIGPLMALPLGQHLMISANFLWDSFSAFFLNLRGLDANVGSVGNALAGNPPYVHYLPLSLAFAILGFALNPRFWPILLWALLVWLLLAWELPVGWNQHRYLTILSPVMLFGFASCLNAFGGGYLRLGLGAAWCLFGIFSGNWFYHRQLTSAYAYQANHGMVAAWLKAHEAPSTRVAVLDTGILAYQSGLRVIDLAGITDHRMALLSAQDDRARLQELLSRPPEERPSLAALHWERNDFNPKRWVALGLLKPIVNISDGQNAPMGVFAFDWSKAQAALK